MTMGELRKHKIYQDIEDAVHTNMNELNMTIKETLKETMLQKHDDGMNEINTNLCVFGTILVSFLFISCSLTNTTFIIFE